MSASPELFLRRVREAAVRYLDVAQSKIGSERWAQLDQVRINGYTISTLQSMLGQDNELAATIIAEFIGADLAESIIQNMLAAEEAK